MYMLIALCLLVAGIITGTEMFYYTAGIFAIADSIDRFARGNGKEKTND